MRFPLCALCDNAELKRQRAALVNMRDVKRALKPNTQSAVVGEGGETACVYESVCMSVSV